MLCITQVFAQNRTVTGTVTAKDDGLPIPGVTVKIKGTTTGVQTGTNGKFTISVPSGGVLVFSFVGYTAQERPVGTSSNLNIVLEPESKQLGEVVVTGALGIKTQARQLGYSTATVDNKLLTEAKVTNAATGLEGKVSGLQVNTADNGVNPVTRIVLRGNRSITGNNEALLVVDGVPIEDDNYINTINPEDIQDVNILKGAVAAAIYGSKASNGVMIITTKKGTKGKTTITVSNTTEEQAVSYMPNLQTEFGPYGGEANYTTADGIPEPVPYENQNYGPPFNGSMQPLALSPIFAADGVTLTGYDTLYNKYSNVPNNRRDFFQNTWSNQINLGIDAGDDNSTIHVGFQDLYQPGVVPNDLYKRDNIRIGGTRNFGSKFSIEYNASYDQSTTSTYGPSYNQTNGSVNNGDPLYFEVLNVGANIPLTSFSDPNGRWGNINSYYNAYATNPYWTVDNSRENTVNYDWLANINLSLKITSWLTLSDRVGLTSRDFTYKQTRPQLQFAPWAIADPWKAGNVPSSLTYVYAGEADEMYDEQRLNNDLILAFNKKFGQFSISGVVGNNLEQNYERYMNLSSSQLQFPGDFNVGSGLGIPSYGEANFAQREIAVYEEATFGYHDYLFLHVTNRDEWNSVLNPDKNHYQYPGADLSFVFTDAINKLKDNDILSYGKIHGGITKVANINLGGNTFGAYSLQNIFSIAGGFPFGSLGGYSLGANNNNPNLTPEETTEYEVGAELGFLKNRINLKVTAYHSDTRNLSLTQAVSTATGFSSQLTNAGLVTNDGQEIDLNVIPVKSRDWTWNLGMNFSHYGNEVKALAQGQTSIQILNPDGGGTNIYAIVGKPYPVIQVNDFNRDPQGRVIVDPVTGEPSQNPNLTTYGTSNPTRIFGLTSSLTYKSWTFAFVIDYRGGNEVFNQQAATEAFTGVSAQTTQNGRQRFIFPNSVIPNGSGGYTPNTSVAVDNGGDTEGSGFWPTIFSNNINSIFVDDASFIKVREANLTYNIPAAFLARNASFIKRASLSVLGRNLFMFRPKSNSYTDPEFSDAGSGNAIGQTSVNETPPTRFFGGNITLTF
jgi:TonB-linked SusC/RagA family outer membrane protein